MTGPAFDPVARPVRVLPIGRAGRDSDGASDR